MMVAATGKEKGGIRRVTAVKGLLGLGFDRWLQVYIP